MILLGALNILLFRYTSQQDIVVGTPITGRRHVDLQDIIGMFVNMLTLKNHPVGTKTFQQFLAEVKQNALDAYENQDYQFEGLVFDLNLQGIVDRNPLFDVVLAMLGVDSGEQDKNSEDYKRFQSLEINQCEFEKKLTPFDLLVTAFESVGQINMFIDYSTDLFKRETVEKMTSHYLEILNQVVNKRDIELKEIRLSYELTELRSDSLLEEEGDFGFQKNTNYVDN